MKMAQIRHIHPARWSESTANPKEKPAGTAAGGRRRCLDLETLRRYLNPSLIENESQQNCCAMFNLLAPDWSLPL